MTVFKIGEIDFSDIVESQTISYNVLLSEKSGRTARGNNVVDIINRKIKLTVNFMPMNSIRMKQFLTAVEPYVINVTFWDAKTDALKTINIYTGTPEITAVKLGIDEKSRRYNGFQLSFIEM